MTYFNILPTNRLNQQYMRGQEETQINEVISHLRTKSTQ